MAINIRLSKADLAERIRRRLGWPVVKVELSTQQIYDAIDYSRDKWMKWSTSQGTTEQFFTVVLSAGENFYDLPLGVVDIIDYNDQGAQWGINTLFTVDNFLFSRGVYDPLIWTGGYAYSLVSYHIAREFLRTVDKYTPSIYNYKYHPYTNQLEVSPAPPSGNALAVTLNGQSVTIDSPGYILIRAFMIEGSQYASYNSNPDNWRRREDSTRSGIDDEKFYTSDWIFDYALAECKITLGMIRRKFTGFASIGNTGIDLDGGDLVSEGKEEKAALEETLRLEENHEGYPIFWG